ncbi:MAG: NADP-dependent oxidoreductase, partial [Gluconacetobacter diazotrophicus]|nr:NADP-dependent oxidoreductase [Gluconacetobacter diazotrophicus]
KDFPLQLPAIPGKDLSGTVRAVGNEVRNFAPGDRVIAMTEATYAELVAVPASSLTRLPDGLDPVDAAALPLACLTGEQLVRLHTRAEAGQFILVTGALGSVGRAAVHAAKATGARLIAGVRGRQAAEAEALDVFRVLALDDDAAIADLEPLDGVADTLGGEVAATLIARVRKGGRFGYASVLPEGLAARHPGIEIGRVFARPDPERLRGFAEDARDNRFVLPVSRRLPLGEAREAHDAMEKGGGGKIVLTV